MKKREAVPTDAGDRKDGDDIFGRCFKSELRDIGGVGEESRFGFINDCEVDQVDQLVDASAEGVCGDELDLVDQNEEWHFQ